MRVALIPNPAVNCAQRHGRFWRTTNQRLRLLPGSDSRSQRPAAAAEA